MGLEAEPYDLLFPRYTSVFLYSVSTSQPHLFHPCPLVLVASTTEGFVLHGLHCSGCVPSTLPSPSYSIINILRQMNYLALQNLRFQSNLCRFLSCAISLCQPWWNIKMQNMKLEVTSSKNLNVTFSFIISMPSIYVTTCSIQCTFISNQ